MPYRLSMFIHMKAKQIMVDEDLLAAIDKETKTQGSKRSKLFRAAVRLYLSRAERLDGYRRRVTASRRLAQR